jgi:hypothetical protein
MLKMMDWNVDQRDRQARASAGECVVANMRKDTDEALVGWAKATGRFVRIDRGTPWSNPFVAPADGERAAVLGRFGVETMPGLVPQLPTLHGRVLGGWSYPAPSHGDLIAEAVNQDPTPAMPLPERPAAYPQRPVVNFMI